MSRLRALIGIVVLTIITTGYSKARELGLGAMVGDPTGINGKVWTSPATAVDFAVAWSTDNERDFHFHMTYLLHDYGVFNVTKGKLPLYYGIGGRIEDSEDPRVGLRGPLGLNYLFARAPIDLFIEIAPVLDITPETDLDVEGGFGFRFYFR